jgi:hypothetical protein
MSRAGARRVQIAAPPAAPPSAPGPSRSKTADSCAAASASPRRAAKIARRIRPDPAAGQAELDAAVKRLVDAAPPITDPAQRASLTLLLRGAVDPK